MSSIEELVFELAEEHTSGDLEKLIKLLNLVLNGKKNLEAPDVSPSAPAPAPAPAPAVASKAKGVKASAPEEEEAF
jgi:hypothetical protein